MWGRELARCERATDNYALGDAVLDGDTLGVAVADVDKEREARGRRHQERLLTTQAVGKRIKIMRELLEPLWEGLGERPEGTIRRLAANPDRLDPEELDAKIGQAVEQSLQRVKMLRDAGVVEGDHPGMFYPDKTFAELECHRLQLAAADAAPPLEPADE